MWEKTDLISIAENLTNEKSTGYTVVFSILQFGNHVNNLVQIPNQRRSFLLESNLKCLFISDTIYYL